MMISWSVIEWGTPPPLKCNFTHPNHTHPTSAPRPPQSADAVARATVLLRSCAKGSQSRTSFDDPIALAGCGAKGAR